jgi:hypothetical protein
LYNRLNPASKLAIIDPPVDRDPRLAAFGRAIASMLPEGAKVKDILTSAQCELLAEMFQLI